MMKRGAMFFALAALALTLAAAPGHAADPSCAVGSEKGAVCACDLAALHPTQFAVGQHEVDVRKAKLREDSPQELERYAEKNPEPTVIGPGGVLYIIDHHHQARILMDLGLRTVRCAIEANLSAQSPDAFWREMADRHWVWPYDARGDGPRPPAELPATVAAMQDDPYRSLAGAVREAGGFGKSDAPFAEFRWAQFFRTRIPAADLDRDFAGAVGRGVALAGEPAACALPGSRAAC